MKKLIATVALLLATSTHVLANPINVEVDEQYENVLSDRYSVSEIISLINQGEFEHLVNNIDVYLYTREELLEIHSALHGDNVPTRHPDVFVTFPTASGNISSYVTVHGLFTNPSPGRTFYHTIHGRALYLSDRYSVSEIISLINQGEFEHLVNSIDIYMYTIEELKEIYSALRQVPVFELRYQTGTRGRDLLIDLRERARYLSHQETLATRLDPTPENIAMGERERFDRLNEIRVEAGLYPLVWFEYSSQITLPNRRLTYAERQEWIAEYWAMGGATVNEMEVLRLVNEYRASRGLVEVQWDDTLGMAARFFAQQPRDLRVYGLRASAGGSDSHNFGPYATNPNARSGASANVAEAFGANLRWHGGNWSSGGSIAAERIVTSWLNSPGHHRYIVSPEHRYLGFGQKPGGISYLFMSDRASN